MDAGIDQIVADATALRGELHALRSKIKVMNDAELDDKLSNLATAADNLAEHAKAAQRKVEDAKEYN